MRGMLWRRVGLPEEARLEGFYDESIENLGAEP